MNKITAYRDGQQREFTQKVWAAMGIGHCGWTAVPEIPKEVGRGWVMPAEDATEFFGENPALLPAKPRKTRQKK